MPLQFTVLASGSAGNASLLELGAFGVLLDAGLGPRNLARRLAAAGACWNRIHAALLTHTHGDHWSDATFRHMLRRRVPLYCHPDHHAVLLAYGRGFAKLRDAELVHDYENGEHFALTPGLRCRPFALPHDGGATFGFRFETASDLFGPTSALAYAADLGSWTCDLAEHMADVDLLALEFNHDVAMQYASGRPSYLVARVLGDDGHLSNVQASTLLQEIMCRTTPGRLQHVVQLHLSRDCNRPELAAGHAHTILASSVPVPRLYTASQHEPIPTIILDGAYPNGCSGRRDRKTRPPRTPVVSADIQPTFPEMEI